jgi:Kef-type K+ transport system membrane component KefB
MFIVDLFILLACTVVAGEIAIHLGQVAMVGQLLAGVALGPTLLGPYIGLNTLTPELTSIQFLATVFILFMAGLEVDPERVYRMGHTSFGLGVALFLVPLAAGFFAVGYVFSGIGYPENLLIALTLSITALPVMGIMLSEFGLLHTKLGDMLLNAALVNEFLAVALFAILLRVGSASVGNLYPVGLAILSVGGFLLVMLLAHKVLELLHSRHVGESFAKRFPNFWRSRKGGLALLMTILIGSTLFSQFIGLTFVIGAFFAGVLVTRESIGMEAYASTRYFFEGMTWGFFIPLFFAFVGVEMNLRLLATPFILTAFLVLVAVAFISKYAAGTSVALLTGWKHADASAVGFLSGSRGVVELAMAIILFQSNMISANVFTIIASIGLITTTIAPIGALQGWLSDPKSRVDLLKRVPSLDIDRPIVPQLRPPEEWTGTVVPTPSSKAFLLKEWLDGIATEDVRNTSISPHSHSGRRDGGAEALSEDENRPPLPASPKKPADM